MKLATLAKRTSQSL